MADLPARKDLHVHLRNLANTVKWMRWFDRPVLKANAIIWDPASGAGYARDISPTEGKECRFLCWLTGVLVCTISAAVIGPAAVICGFISYMICYLVCG
jgi:hypothetical protein